MQRTVQLTLTYPEKMSNKIISAGLVPVHLLLYPGMGPTNNRTERWVRPIVLYRKVNSQIGSIDGMRRFGVLFTCLLTRRKRKLDIYRSWTASCYSQSDLFRAETRTLAP